jgi:hypothetical protein
MIDRLIRKVNEIIGVQILHGRSFQGIIDAVFVVSSWGEFIRAIKLKKKRRRAKTQREQNVQML